MIGGYEALGVPLQGFSGFDCSVRNCPKGDNINNMLTGQKNNAFEVQKVVCYGSGYRRESAFALHIFNQTSDIIYGNYNAAQIKAAIESIKSIGTVSVIFNTTDKYFDKACLPRNGSYYNTGRYLRYHLFIFTFAGVNIGLFIYFFETFRSRIFRAI